jgi:hypothetical protein
MAVIATRTATSARSARLRQRSTRLAVLLAAVLIAPLLFRITPVLADGGVLTLDRSTVTPGGTIILTGAGLTSHYNSNELIVGHTISITLCRGNGDCGYPSHYADYPPVTTDSTGSFTASLVIPTDTVPSNMLTDPVAGPYYHFDLFDNTEGGPGFSSEPFTVTATDTGNTPQPTAPQPSPSQPTAPQPTAPQPPAPLARSGDIIPKAKGWVNANLPYNQRSLYNGYREDCSGLVSMAWGLSSLGGGLTTYTLPSVSHSIQKEQLRGGDIVINVDGGGDPTLAHVLIFDSWSDSSMTTYNAYEENPYWNGAHYTKNIPYPFWPGYDSSQYSARRLNGS